MTGHPASIKEEIETSMAEELEPGSHGRSQEHLVKSEMMDRGSSSLGVSQEQQNLESKASGSAAAQPVWDKTATWPKKMGHQPQMPGMSREQGHGDPQPQMPGMSREQGRGDPQPQERPDSFQGMRFQYERNPEADMLAQIGLEELNSLEMEVMRRQLQVITQRLRALEDQGTSCRRKEAVLFTLLVSACVANLWLWMRQ